MKKIRTGSHHGNSQGLEMGGCGTGMISRPGSFINTKGRRIDKKTNRLLFGDLLLLLLLRMFWYCCYGNRGLVVQGGCCTGQVCTGCLTHTLFVPTGGLGRNLWWRNKKTRSRSHRSSTSVTYWFFEFTIFSGKRCLMDR